MLVLYFWLTLSALTLLRLVGYYTKPNVYTDDTKIRIQARLTTEPVRYSNSQYLKLEGYKIYLPLYPETSYSDKLTVEGVVEGKNLKHFLR